MSKIEWVALVGIVGTTLVSWLLLFGAAFLGYQVSFWLTVVICGGVLLLVARRKINSTRFTQPNYQQVIFVLAWGALFAGLLQTRMLEKSRWLVFGWSNLGRFGTPHQFYQQIFYPASARLNFAHLCPARNTLPLSF